MVQSYSGDGGGGVGDITNYNEVKNIRTAGTETGAGRKRKRVKE